MGRVKITATYTYTCSYCGKSNTVKDWGTYHSTGRYPEYCNMRCFTASKQADAMPKHKEAWDLYADGTGRTWDEVGELMGISRQAAYEHGRKYDKYLESQVKNNKRVDKR